MGAFSALTGALAELATALGAHVTSTVRSAAENAAVHGSPTSKHLTGEAIDFRMGTVSPTLRAVLSAFGTVAEHQKGTAPHIHFEIDGRKVLAALGVVTALVLLAGSRERGSL